MNVTDVKIRKILNEGRLRAVVSITIENAIAIHDIKVIEGETRYFVAMPSRREESGAFRDIVHPISVETRSYLENLILEAYKEAVENMIAESETTEEIEEE